MQGDSNEQVHLAARLYYVDGWDQAQVAELVRVSQAKVSRLLSSARKHGIVRITVTDYDSRQRTLARELIEKLGLKTAIVIKAMEDLPISQLRLLTAHFAAPLVETMISPGTILAVGGGPGLQDLVHRFPMGSSAPTILQAQGRTGSQINLSDAQELGRSIAEKWNGKFILLNAPAHLPTKSACDALLKQEQIQSIVKKWSQATGALLEISTVTNSPLADSLGRDQLEQLKTLGAVGEICGRYFDRQGNECPSSVKAQTIGLDFETLRRIPEVIGLSIGKDNSPAVLGAIQGGLVKSLITDESAARSVLDIADNEMTDKKAAMYYHLS
jgi:deoxyribonucleoside regulator